MRQAVQIFVYVILVTLSGCTSTSTKNDSLALNFSTVLSFKIGTTSETDIVSILGSPSEVVQKNEYYILYYNDSETGFQRLSVSISRSDNKLLSVLWLPKENEIESSLDSAKKSFANAQYQEKSEKNSLTHMVSSDIVLYVDKQFGVTIRYDKRKNEVEAIALYDLKKRIPSTVK